MSLWRNRNLGLIPRNNWDYGVADAARSLTAAFRGADSAVLRLPQLPKADALLTGSGRASLYAILKSLALPSGARVGVPLYCCSVVFDAIRQAGFEPAFLDIGSRDYNLAPADLARKRPQLAAVVVVHMFGNPADMDRIREAANGLPVVEDCAQSLFSSYRGQPTGSLSDASFFSFRSGKYLSAGTGSAVYTEDPEVHRRVRDLVDAFARPSGAGQVLGCFSTYLKSALYQRPWYGTIGRPIGVRLDRRLNLTAKSGFETTAISASCRRTIEHRLTFFEERIGRQRRHAECLLTNLVLPGAVLPAENDGCRGNWFQFPVRFESRERRDAVAAFLLENGIDAAKYLDDIVDVCRADFGYQGDCPEAERCSRTTLCVPIHYTLSPGDVEHIAKTLNRSCRRG